MSEKRKSGKAVSTEEFIRSVFEGAERRKRTKDHTPRTFQPDGSMDTEDWLREVVFGVERAAAPVRAVALQPELPMEPPTPFGRGTVLFPGKRAPGQGGRGKAESRSNPAAEDTAGIMALPENVRRMARRAAPTVSALAEPLPGLVRGAIDGEKRAVNVARRFAPTLFSLPEVAPALAHGAHKGLDETKDLVYELGGKLRKHLPEAMDYSLNWDFREGGKGFSVDKGAPVAVPTLPNVFPAPNTALGRSASGVGQFGVGYLFGNKLLRGVSAGTKGAAMLKGLGAGAIADFTAFDGQEERLSNLVQRHPEVAGPVTEYLAARPEDGEIEGRLKNVLEGLGLGAAAESFLHGLRLTRAGRTATRNELEREAQRMSLQRRTRDALKRSKLTPPAMDYTDSRGPDAMHYAGRELREVGPSETDRLFVGSGNKAGYYTGREATGLMVKYRQDHAIATSALETSPGQWKLRVDAVPPPATAGQLRGVAEKLHRAALRGEKPSYAVGIAGPEEAARVKAATGYNVLLHRRALNAEDVMHGMDRHNRQAAAVGEQPITYADMARYNEIVGTPDVISRGRRPNSIIYEKRYPDGTVYVAEQILRGNNIEFRSMYKNKVAERMRSSLLFGGPARGTKEAGEDE